MAFPRSVIVPNSSMPSAVAVTRSWSCSRSPVDLLCLRHSRCTAPCDLFGSGSSVEPHSMVRTSSAVAVDIATPAPHSNGLVRGIRGDGRCSEPWRPGLELKQSCRERCGIAFGQTPLGGASHTRREAGRRTEGVGQGSRRAKKRTGGREGVVPTFSETGFPKSHVWSEQIESKRCVTSPAWP